MGQDAGQKIHALIQGRSGNPFGGLVSGSLDLDKMEYLRRDARFCGVPYGEVDVDRLLQGFAILTDPETGASRWACMKRPSAPSSRCSSRSTRCSETFTGTTGFGAAAALYKRIINEAVRANILDAEELVGPTVKSCCTRWRGEPRHRIRRLESGWPRDGFLRSEPGGFRSAHWR